MLTFKDLSKPIKVKTKQGVKTTTINPENIFRRSIALIRYRTDLDFLTVMSKPTGGAPLSMFHEDGLMRKPTKAILAHILEEGISSSFSWPLCNPSSSVYIIDVMVLLHKTPAQHYCKTFGELVQSLLTDVLKIFEQVDTVICVFDQYNDPNDVKAYERRRRATTTQREYEVMGDYSLPNRKHFLEVDANKTSFCNFMSKYFIENASSGMKNSHRLILTGGFEDRTI